MRRKVLEFPLVVPYYSFFSWRKCWACRDEFRREKGWMWVSDGRPEYAKHKFLCQQCGSNKDIAESVLCRLAQPPNPPPKNP